jgi:hypothetical protein
MALRGRGALEIKTSNSPFFATTSQTFGIDPYSRPEWDSHKKTHNQQQPNQVEKYNKIKTADEIDVKMMNFLYTRESDRIGSKPNNLVELKSQMATDMRNQQQNFREIRQAQEEEDEEERILYEESMMTSQQKPTHNTAEDILKHYKHVPKAEHPLYITAGVSNNII